MILRNGQLRDLEIALLLSPVVLLIIATPLDYFKSVTIALTRGLIFLTSLLHRVLCICLGSGSLSAFLDVYNYEF